MISLEYNGSLLWQSDLSETAIRLGKGIRHLLTFYELHRDPDKLEFLLYQMNKLYHVVATVDGINRDMIDAIAVTFSVLEELQSSESVVETRAYVPQPLAQYCRGCPRLFQAWVFVQEQHP